MGTTIIAAIAFLAGIIFANSYPFFVRWLDTRSAITTQVHRGAVAQRIDHALGTHQNKAGETAAVEGSSPSSFTTPPIHRRVGLAEARRKAELKSMEGATHQAEVTANNARAMS